MPFATYGELKAAVATWLARTDLTTNIVDFVTLARQRVSNDLKLRGLDVMTTGVLTAADQLALPADRDEIRSFEIALSSGEITTLQLTDPSTFAEARSPSWSGGQVTFYMIQGNVLLLAPAPGIGAAYTLRYYATKPAQPADNTTDAILSQYPNLMLYASLLEAEPFLRNDERIVTWQAFYDRALTAARKLEWNSRVGGGKLAGRPVYRPVSTRWSPT